MRKLSLNMGACCSKNAETGGVLLDDESDDSRHGVEEDRGVSAVDGGAIARLRGSSSYVSMATKQGNKGINQDAMTVWENFASEKDMFFCGVFDGHGSAGHKMSNYVRENLPSRIHSAISKACSVRNLVEYDDEKFFQGFKAGLLESFKKVDEELSLVSSYDSFCSGTTAVTIIKQGDRLVIANLGDSRAVLCTRRRKKQLIPVQLTVDLKPSIPSEAERIRSCNGRVFAMGMEPELYRVWMPDENCPGLAMTRAFGDFCLKDYGLISTPDVYCRILTSKDEFVVLATDGIWDVLTNYDVIKTVAAVKNRSMAAEILVRQAVEAWGTKFPNARADDCAVVILFLKDQPSNQSMSAIDTSKLSAESSEIRVPSGLRSRSTSEQEGLLSDLPELNEAARVNSSMRLPRFGSRFCRRSSEDDNDTMVGFNGWR